MLNRRQLEDVAKCWHINCEDCSCGNIPGEFGAFNCSMEVSQTALTLLDMLKRLEWSDGERYDGITIDKCPICGEKKYNGHTKDCELFSLLKESGGSEKRKYWNRCKEFEWAERYGEKVIQTLSRRYEKEC